MRVRVVISYDFSEDERRTVNAYYGDPGLADRETLKSCIEMFGEPTNENWACGIMDETGDRENQ